MALVLFIYLYLNEDTESLIKVVIVADSGRRGSWKRPDGATCADRDRGGERERERVSYTGCLSLWETYSQSAPVSVRASLLALMRTETGSWYTSGNERHGLASPVLDYRTQSMSTSLASHVSEAGQCPLGSRK